MPATESTLDDLVARALAEDVGDGDVTTAVTVPENARARATITQKAPGVIYGLDAAQATFRAVDPELAMHRLADEGQWRERGPVLEIEGSARAILTAERTALNFLQRLSGVATLTARCVQAVQGTGVRILDTRKTTPGMRTLEKAAVAAGGGTNHRAGLYDAILIKENHSALAGGVGPAVRRATELAPGTAARSRMRHAGGGRRGACRGREQHPAGQHDPRADARGRGPRVRPRDARGERWSHARDARGRGEHRSRLHIGGCPDPQRSGA